MVPKEALEVGDVAVMKKKHPCGSTRWRLLRVGADVRMECLGCGHMVMLTRSALEKRLKDLVKET